MEKVFASSRSPLEISVAVARTSQSPFPLSAITPNITLKFAGMKFVLIFVQIKIRKNMLIASVSDFRKDIKSYLDKVAKNFETLVINRGKDSGIVVMSLTEYNSLMATNHELSSRANEVRLDSAIEKLRLQKSFEKNLMEG